MQPSPTNRPRATRREGRLGARPRLPRAGVILAFLVAVPAARGLEVTPQDQRVSCGPPCILQVPVLVAGTANLDAVGFDLLFEGDKLAYRSMRRGPLVRRWAAFDAELLPGDRLRVGGFDGTSVALAGTDTLAVLSFEARIPVGCTSYRTDALVDDLASAAPHTGFAAWDGWEYPANGYIALYPSGGPPLCCYDTPGGTVLQVVAHTAGASADGILGAEFRVEVSPPAPGGTFLWTPDAAVLGSAGDPIDNGAAGDSAGVRLTFAGCRAPYEQAIPLGTIVVRGLDGVHDLLVKRHERPAEPRLPCAQWLLCNDATCSIACMARTMSMAEDPVVFRAHVNDVECGSVACGFVPAVARSWAGVKQLFR